MVKDPTTGKMVTAPEYGGTITWANSYRLRTDSIEPYVSYTAGLTLSRALYEKLGNHELGNR